jgi:tryptophan-rich sensory protein
MDLRPVWTLLSVLMAVVAWLIWCQGGWIKQPLALTLFLLQWLLNALWTPLFFGLHRSGLACAEIVLLWLALSATLGSFWQVRKAAGVSFIPYLAWVSFAAMLNFTI